MNMNVNMNKMSSGVVVVDLGSDSPKAHNEMPSSNDTLKLASEKTTMKRWVVSSSSSREGGGSQPKRKVLERMKKWTVRMHQMVWKVGKDDPRRVVHSIKVGLSLTLLSLIYLLEPLFQGIGQNAIWAVLFVILIFEFTAGATLYKGLNQGIGTLSALFLAFIVKVISQSMGRTGYAVFIGFSVFVIGMLTTYIRFFPSVKKYYDQGVLVFFATYNLITVSGYRDQNMLHMVFQRLYVIAIGFGLCILMSILILPNWSGKDLQNSIISKIEALAKSINACVNEYFQEPDKKLKGSYSSKDLDGGYEASLECKSADEALEIFASLEPQHSRYCYPWQQYVQLGKILRHLGYTAISLHGCLGSQIQHDLLKLENVACCLLSSNGTLFKSKTLFPIRIRTRANIPQNTRANIPRASIGSEAPTPSLSHGAGVGAYQVPAPFNNLVGLQFGRTIGPGIQTCH